MREFGLCLTARKNTQCRTQLYDKSTEEIPPPKGNQVEFSLLIGRIIHPSNDNNCTFFSADMGCIARKEVCLTTDSFGSEENGFCFTESDWIIWSEILLRTDETH